jgi:hypothetical protein
MMFRALAESAAVCIFYCAVIIPLGCIPLPATTNDLEPFIAVTGNYSIAEKELAEPTPAPEPESDKCETCRGTGKADGRVTCPVCNGTGKKKKQAAVTPPATRIVYHPPLVVTARECQSGTCSIPTIVR